MPTHSQNCAASSTTPLSARKAAIAARIPYARALYLLGLGILPAKRPGWRWNVDTTHLLEWRAVGYSWRAKRSRKVPETFH